MKIALAVLSLLALGAGEIAAAPDVPRLAITSPEKTSMKDDLGKENPNLKAFVRWNAPECARVGHKSGHKLTSEKNR